MRRRRFGLTDRVPLVGLATAGVLLAALWLFPTSTAHRPTRRRTAAAGTSPTPELPVVAVDARPIEAGGMIRSVVPVDGGGPVVALSFDDGPDPTWTPEVLNVLQGLRIRAAFCLIGRSARAHPDLV